MSIDNHHLIEAAIAQILADYDDVVSVENKRDVLLKFGKNFDLQAADEWETVMEHGATETFQTTNAINSISSSDAGDTGTITLTGHTILGGLLTRVTQTVTLTGQTPVTLTTALCRVERGVNAEVFALGSEANFDGTIYVFKSGGTVTAGVPQTAADIYLTMNPTDQQSNKGQASIAQDEYLILTQVGGFVRRQATAVMDFQLQWRELGTVFRTHLPFSASDTSATILSLDPYLVVPKNSDIRIQANSSANSTAATAFFNGFYASVTR